eukprot:evm.model.NODE_38439_length_6783_cov_11.629515.2
MEAQLIKFKRLLTMSRERLEENQRQISDKNQAIDRLTHEVDTIKTKLSRSQSQAIEQTQAAAAATTALQQLQHQLKQQQHKQQQHQKQQQQQQRQQREGGKEKSTRLSLEAQGRVDRLQEELRKYRVRSELAMRHKNAEIKHLTAAALAAQQHKIDNEAPDEEELKRTVKLQADKIQALKAELNEQEGKWRTQYQQLQKEKEALEGAGAETALAAQWRKRYEGLVKQQQQQQQQQVDSGHGRNEEGQGGHRLSLSGSGPVEEKYNELKEEYRLYRKKALEALKEKDSLISILDREGGGGGGREGRREGGRGVTGGGGLEGGAL